MNPAAFREGDLERIAAQAEELLARAEGLKDEIEGVVGTGESRDGQVRVSVAASGRVTEIALAPRAMRMESQKLAEELLIVAQQAHDDAEAKVKALMADVLGDTPFADPTAIEERFAGVLDSYTATMDERLQVIHDAYRDRG
jgi:DNA-binding protein YbaB